jgi:hypothetical protein
MQSNPCSQCQVSFSPAFVHAERNTPDEFYQRQKNEDGIWIHVRLAVSVVTLLRIRVSIHKQLGTE